jgi:hypothetical protein
MKTKLYIILSLLILTCSGLALSEKQTTDTNIPLAPAPVAVEETLQVSDDSSNTQWVWGEVSSVDAQNQALNLKYLDYETDQEKEMVITTDDLTVYDNAKSLGDIQPKDNISVDYVVKDGKNAAKTIGLEKAENEPAADAAPQTSEGIDAQPPQVNQ